MTAKAVRQGPEEMDDRRTKMQLNQEDDQIVAWGGSQQDNKTHHNARRAAQRRIRRDSFAKGMINYILEGPPPKIPYPRYIARIKMVEAEGEAGTKWTEGRIKRDKVMAEVVDKKDAEVAEVA